MQQKNADPQPCLHRLMLCCPRDTLSSFLSGFKENNGNAENSRRSGRLARKSSVYEERKKQAEELENKLVVRIRPSTKNPELYPALLKQSKKKYRYCSLYENSYGYWPRKCRPFFFNRPVLLFKHCRTVYM